MKYCNGRKHIERRQDHGNKGNLKRTQKKTRKSREEITLGEKMGKRNSRDNGTNNDEIEDFIHLLALL